MPVAWRVRNLLLYSVWHLADALNEFFNSFLFGDFVVDLDWYSDLNLDVLCDRDLDFLVELDLCRDHLSDFFADFRGHLNNCVDLHDDRHFYLPLEFHDYWHSLRVIFIVLDGFEDFSGHVDHLGSLLNSGD